MTHNTDPETLTWADLGTLKLSPLNTRQTYSEGEIADMAASIGAVGLIQNLSGIHTETGIEIVAGGKRLLALQQLVEQGAEFSTVPVRVTTDENTARAWSMAENAARSRPHPADEIRAFRTMFAKTGNVDLIARTFAETETHVRRRLRLAQLGDDTLDALRADQISLNTAQTLTMAPDPDAEAKLLKALLSGEMRPGALRHSMETGSVPINDRRVQYVGLHAYVAAGGNLTEDLFEDRTLLHNEDMLDTLFKDKLTAAAETAREDKGWQWATPILDPWLGYTHTENLERLFLTPGEITEADAERMDALSELYEAGVLDAEGEAELDNLTRRLDGDFTDEDRATGGIFVYVDREGDLCTAAFRRPQDNPDRQDEGTGAGSLDEGTGVEQHKTPPITKAGQEALERIALAALQSAANAKFQLMLDLLAFQIAENPPGWSAPLAVTFNRQPIDPGEVWGVFLSETLTVGDNRTTDYNQTPEQRVTAFRDFRLAGTAHRNHILTEELARALRLPQGVNYELGRLIAEEAAASVRKIWTPGAAFFKTARPDVLDRWWCDLLDLEEGDERIAEFGRMKKGEKVKALTALFSDASVQEAHGLSRAQVARIDAWLPPQLEAWA